MNRTALRSGLLGVALFALGFTAIFSGYTQSRDIRVSPAPGVYAGELSVTLHGEGPDSELFYRFRASDTQRWIPYHIPITLPATEGSERRYTIELATRNAGSADAEIIPRATYSYRIDTRAPARPAIHTDSAAKGGLELSFRGDEDAGIYYWHSAAEQDEFTAWNGETLQIPASSALATGPFYVSAYARDTAGNRSPLAGRNLSAGEKERVVEEIRLPSPVEGRFVNPQLLYVANSDRFDWVRYTVNGADPVYRGAVYREPLLLRAKGEYQLRIAARTLGGRILRKERLFTVTGEEPLFFDFQSGRVERPREISPPSRENGYVLYYNRSEREVSTDDPFLQESLPLFSPVPALQHESVRIGVLDPVRERLFQYRFFFIYDNRNPGPPRIDFDGKTPFQERLSVRIRGPEEARLYYSTDGSTPDEFSRLYSEPFTLSAPQGVDAGSIRVQAVAIYPNGKRSPVTSRLVEYDTQRPAAPKIVLQERSSRSATIQLRAEGARYFRYELAFNRTPEEPSLRSPRSGEELQLEFPRGLSAEVHLRVLAEDRAGNLSHNFAAAQFRVDSVAPPRPQARFENRALRITGEEELFYHLERARREELLPDTPAEAAEFTPFREPVTIEGREGQRSVYRAWAFSRDAAGNRSAIAVSEVLSIDRRRPDVPSISGTTDKNLYREATTIALSSDAGSGGIEYRLFRAQGGKSPTIDENRPFQAYDAPLVLEGEQGSSVTYLLEYRGRIAGAAETSELRRERIVIDRAPPSPPRLYGVEQQGSYNAPVLIRGEADGGRVWVWAVEDEQLERSGQDASDKLSEGALPSPQLLKRNGRPADEGVVVSCPPGEERRYTLFSASFDRAGNATLLSQAIRFRIDRIPPQLPELRGLPAEGVSAEDVELVPEEGDYAGIKYELSRKNGVPPLPTRHSPVARDTLLFTGEEGRRVAFTLRYRAVDEAGNLSTRSGELRWVIDRRIPTAPELQITRAGSRVCLVNIDLPQAGERLYYSLADGRYTEYRRPFVYRISGGRSAPLLRAYAQSPTGIQSDVVESVCLQYARLSPLVVGLSDGALYKEDVTVRAGVEGEAEASLRYRLEQLSEEEGGQPARSASGGSPSGRPATGGSQAGLFSPEFPEEGLTLRALKGQSSSYRLSVALVDPDLSVPLRRESYTVTIDKAAPPVPKLDGVSRGGYFTASRSIAMHLPGEERAEIRYSLGSRGEPVGPFQSYEKPIEIEAPSGTMREFRLSYFAVDEAGNRSETREIFFTIDRDGLYVAPNGNDRASGSRSEPFRTLSRALREVRESERSTIVLAGGDYSLQDAAAIAGSAQIKGGYGRDDWRPTGGQSRISVARSAGKEAPGLSVAGGKLLLERILINGAAQKGPLIEARGDAEVTLNNCTLVSGTTEQSAALSIHDSRLRMHGSVIDLGPIRNGYALKSDRSRIELRDVSVTGGRNAGETTLFLLRESETILRNLRLSPGSGDALTGIDLQGGTLDIDGGRYEAGTAGRRSTLFNVRNARLTITGAQLLARAGETEGQLLTGIRSEGGSLVLEECRMEIEGYNGAVALKSVDSDVRLRASQIRMSGQHEFTYLLRSNGGSADLRNSLLLSDSAFDNVTIEFKGTQARMQHITLVHGGGERLSAGIRYAGDTLELRSSVLAGERESSGALIELLGNPRELLIEENLIAGWSRLLLRPDGTAIRSLSRLEGVQQADETGLSARANRTERRVDLFSDDQAYPLRDEDARSYGYAP